MIHIAQYGSSVTAATAIRQTPYTTLVSEARLTVGVAPAVALLAVVAGFSYLVVVRNTSANNIRIGSAPLFTAPIAGILLPSTATLILDNWGASLNIVADAAGSVVDLGIWRTS